MSNIDPESRAIARGAKLKIGRAIEHIGELEREIAAYIAMQPVKLIIRDDYANARSHRFVRTEHPIPDRVSLALGDAIHNLRAALDIAIFSIVGHKTEADFMVAFPFARSERALESTMRRCQLDFAGPRVRGAVESLRPYEGGNPWLESLHKLDIEDKHKLILPTIQAVKLDSTQMVEFAPVGPPDQAVAGVNWVIEVGASFQFEVPIEGENRAARRSRRKAKPHEYPFRYQPPCVVHFADGPPIQHMPVIEALPKMADMVRLSCEAIAAAHAVDEAPAA